MALRDYIHFFKNVIEFVTVSNCVKPLMFVQSGAVVDISYYSDGIL